MDCTAMETPLVRIAADYDCSQLLRATAAGKGFWDGVCFTTDDVVDRDYLVSASQAAGIRAMKSVAYSNIYLFRGLHVGMILGG
jgi:hypothetical protein